MKIITFNDPKPVSRWRNASPHRELADVQRLLSKNYGITAIAGSLMYAVCRIDEVIYSNFLMMVARLQGMGIKNLDVSDMSVDKIIEHLEKLKLDDAVNLVAVEPRPAASPPPIVPPVRLEEIEEVPPAKIMTPSGGVVAVEQLDVQRFSTARPKSKYYLILVEFAVTLGKAIMSILMVIPNVVKFFKSISNKNNAQLIQFYNHRHQRISAYLDFPTENTKMAELTWVVIPPAFGKTKETAFLLALYLKANGCGVLRFDDTDSVGESEGEIHELTLSNSTKNIHEAVEYLRTNYNAVRIGLVPFSLSARAAIKAAAQDPSLAFVMPIVGAPNIESLLDKVYGENLIADYLCGKRKETLNLLGHPVDSDRFLGDAIIEGFADLSSTMADLEKAPVPMVWFCGEDDPWVRKDEVQGVLEVNPGQVYRQRVDVQGLQHRVREAGVAQELFACVVSQVLFLTLGEAAANMEIKQPSSVEIVNRGITERKRVQRRISREEEIASWDKYLKDFDVLLETEDYPAYLNSLFDQLQVRPGEKALDVGTGNGNFIAFLLNRMAMALKTSGWKNGEITGIDFVAEAVARAETKANEVKKKRLDLPKTYFQTLDVEKDSLPHNENYYDKIIASLFLSYVREPRTAVKKLCRSLKPGGTIVLTSLKPEADVSQIYHRFLEKIKREVPSPERDRKLIRGRELLNSAIGWIENREESGDFTYFSGKKLIRLLEGEGIAITRSISSFGDQAVIVVGQKKSK
ncbi:methyltransferase domain-containing protein [Candidatus Saganbacteria bacterium]|nr:methyltransferase domain-containing protein [Candidatus Saganbacteria bacterium]